MSNSLSSITIIILLLIIIRITILILTNTFHPISIIIICLRYNIRLSIYITLWKTPPIFPLIFLLIIVRGLLIIFLYFARTISNSEPYRHFNFKRILILIFPWISSLTFLLPLPKLPATSNINLHFLDLTPNFIRLIFKPPLSSLTLIRIVYLLLCLIAIIKICSPKIKTLRKLN